MAADEVAPARAVWRLGDYHRFARDQLWEVGPVVVAACGIVADAPLDTLWHAVPSFPTVSEVWLRLLEAYGL